MRRRYYNVFSSGLPLLGGLRGYHSTAGSGAAVPWEGLLGFMPAFAREPDEWLRGKQIEALIVKRIALSAALC